MTIFMRPSTILSRTVVAPLADLLGVSSSNDDVPIAEAPLRVVPFVPPRDPLVGTPDLSGVPAGSGRDLQWPATTPTWASDRPADWSSSPSPVGRTAEIEAVRERLAETIREAFADLNRRGIPLEPRPGSRAAEAFADGDFSSFSSAELVALVLLLSAFGRDQDAASRPDAALAPRGTWRPDGTNTAGGGTDRTGVNADAAPPTGPAPTGKAPTSTTDAGRRLGDAAESIAAARGTTGRCYAGVADALARVGVTVTGLSAYMAADQLAAMPDKFEEVQVSPDQLKNLPRGAVVVWGKSGEKSPHGHISVALGDGREASDHISSQLTSLRGETNYRVFIPR